MRGHGGSGAADPEPRWATDALIADVNAVLDREGVERCHFVGESWGGTIGLAWAAGQRGRAQSVTVMSTTYAGRLVPNIETFPDMLRDGRIEAWSERMVEGRFMADAAPELKQWVHEAQLACSAKMLAAMFDYIMEQDIGDVLGTIECPVLILAPQGSPFVPPTVAADLLSRLKDAEMQRFTGHRHGLVLSGAALGAAALASFIDRRGGAA
jgi:pimeloyl-ACP methyl ester carboxylesterase